MSTQQYSVQQQGKAMELWAQKEPQEHGPDGWQCRQNRVSIFSTQWDQSWDGTERSLYERLRQIYGNSASPLIRDSVIGYFQQERQRRLEN